MSSRGTEATIGLSTYTAVIVAWYHLAMAAACSIACADWFEKSIGHRMRSIFISTSLRPARIACVEERDNVRVAFAR
jgi:hypothetical protein